MALTSRGSQWEWMQSWYVLLTLPFVTHPLAFFYIGARAGRTKWILYGLVYLASIVAPAYVFITYRQESPDWEVYVWLVYLVLWLWSPIHAFIARKEFLLRLDQQGVKDVERTDKLKAAIKSELGTHENRVEEALIDFNEDDVTVRLCNTLFGVMPFAPDFRYYFNIEGAAQRLDHSAPSSLTVQARQVARDDDFAAAIKVVRGLDAIDSGLGIFTGFKNVYDHIKTKDRPRTFEADPQQAADAAVKALGIAYMIARLYPGGVFEKVKQFFSTPAGQELVIYYASIEIALPFADNLAEGGAGLMDKILENNQQEMEKRFKDFAGGGALQEAEGVLEQFKGQVQNLLSQVKLYVDPLTKKVEAFAPQAMNIADSTTGAVATAIDFLPAYKFLGARLAAEAAVLRAQKAGGASAPAQA